MTDMEKARADAERAKAEVVRRLCAAADRRLADVEEVRRELARSQRAFELYAGHIVMGMRASGASEGEVDRVLGMLADLAAKAEDDLLRWLRDHEYTIVEDEEGEE